MYKDASQNQEKLIPEKEMFSFHFNSSKLNKAIIKEYVTVYQKEKI